MKTIPISCLALVFLSFIVSCGPSNTQAIGKNVDPDVTNLEDAKTYTWTSDIDEIPDARVFVSPTGVYVFNNESARKKIKDAIEHELNAKGYTMSSSTDTDPGMLVSFYVLEQSDTLRNVEGYVTINGEPVISEEDVELTPVEPGTLIINVVDNKSDKMVWQGFASGILKPEDVNDKAKIRQAVSSIFSQFTYEATNNQ